MTKREKQELGWQGARILLAVMLLVALVVGLVALQSEVKDVSQNIDFETRYPNFANELKFIETGLQLNTLADVNTIEEADLVIVSADLSMERDKLVEALNFGKPLVFVGTDAEDALLATLLNIAKADVKSLVGKTRKPEDIKFSFGSEFEETSSDYVAIASPTGDVLGIHVFRTEEPQPPEEYILLRIERALQYMLKEIQ